MKRSEPVSIGDIISKVFNESGPKILHQQASYLWTEVVGPGVNRYTTRRYVTPEGVMHVYISSAPLKNELQFMRRRLVDAINSRIGQEVITAIEIH